MRLTVPGSVTGTTCTGTPVGSSPCQQPGHPDVFILIDAPPGTQLRLTASPGLSILGFPNCDSENTFQCAYAAPFFEPEDPRMRLFAVERVDTNCGEFTLEAVAK